VPAQQHVQSSAHDGHHVRLLLRHAPEITAALSPPIRAPPKSRQSNFHTTTSLNVMVFGNLGKSRPKSMLEVRLPALACSPERCAVPNTSKLNPIGAPKWPQSKNE
jgi:hypothetical protein